tara:strand:+ start:4646 stop:4954 length:309 start_codon:yes stop_codon:yes gene_type:complete
MNIDKADLIGEKLQPLHIPELNGEVYLRHITQKEAQEIADKYNSPDGADTEEAGLALLQACVCTQEGEPILSSTEEVAKVPVNVLQRILNELGFGEEAIRGN